PSSASGNSCSPGIYPRDRILSAIRAVEQREPGADIARLCFSDDLLRRCQSFDCRRDRHGHLYRCTTRNERYTDDWWSNRLHYLPGVALPTSQSDLSDLWTGGERQGRFPPLPGTARN